MSSFGKDPLSILIIDDERDLRELLAEALQWFGYTTSYAASVDEALKLLEVGHFDLLFCDLMMPGADGFSLMEVVRSKYPEIPIIVLTGYASIDLTQKAIRLGAQDFILKPFNVRELPFIVERNLARIRLETQIHAQQTERLLFQTVQALVAAIEAKDPYTAGHSHKVSILTAEFAKALQLPDTDMFALKLAGLVHDVGKIGIPEDILLKPGRLDSAEWELMRQHPIIGAAIVGQVHDLGFISKVIRSHHERWDGQGYPDGLKGESIPFLSRILYLADVYDALTSDRSYRKRLGPRQALQVIRNQIRTHFDANLVQLMIDSVLPNMKQAGHVLEQFTPPLSLAR